MSMAKGMAQPRGIHFTVRSSDACSNKVLKTKRVEELATRRQRRRSVELVSARAAQTKWMMQNAPGTAGA